MHRGPPLNSRDFHALRFGRCGLAVDRIRTFRTDRTGAVTLPATKMLALIVKGNQAGMLDKGSNGSTEAHDSRPIQCWKLITSRLLLLETRTPEFVKGPATKDESSMQKKDDKIEYWAAATIQEKAAAAVEKELGPGWTVTLTDRRLTGQRLSKLRMRPA
jgi:hypothetical protein